jgi:hypothetical protein
MKDKQTPQDSPAAWHIIARAHAGSPSNKLLDVIPGYSLIFYCSFRIARTTALQSGSGVR